MWGTQIHVVLLAPIHVSDFTPGNIRSSCLRNEGFSGRHKPPPVRSLLTSAGSWYKQLLPAAVVGGRLSQKDAGAGVTPVQKNGRRTCPCPRETEATSRFGFHCVRFNHRHLHGYIWKFSLKRTLEVSLMAIIQMPVLCQASCRKMMNSSEDTKFKKLFCTILYSIFPGVRLNWF